MLDYLLVDHFIITSNFAELLDHALAAQFPDAVKRPAQELRETSAAVKSACQMIEVNSSHPLPAIGYTALKTMSGDAKKKFTVSKTMLRSVQSA